jgi:hypothetical protein
MRTGTKHPRRPFTILRGNVISGISRARSSPNLRFAVLSFLCIAAFAMLVGTALASFLSSALATWDSEDTAILVRREVEAGGLEALFTTGETAQARQRWADEIRRRFMSLPGVTRVKIWDIHATVLWSDEARLIGQQFSDNEQLRAALAGRISAEMTHLSKKEQVYDDWRYTTLAEVYVPIRAAGSGPVVGVVEVYKIPTRLIASLKWGLTIVWAVVLGGGLLLYLALLPLVRWVYVPRSTSATTP